jgi:stage II sporulation protein D
MTAVIRVRSAPAVAGAFLAAVALSAVVLSAVALLSPVSAGAATSAGLYIRGAGFGHGVGMSQYGAAGYALHGATYPQILRDYYSGTTLGVANPDRTVTVLLRPNGAAAFSGATTIKGVTSTNGVTTTQGVTTTKGATTLKSDTRPLNPNTNYSVLVTGAKLRIMSGGRTFGVVKPPLQVSGPGPLKLLGTGAYRGALVFRPSAGGGVMTVNALGLDDYVRGVVGAEMPTSWPQQALEAQAVAARTYALTRGATGAGFDLYDNTRSQMYEGVAAETPTTDAAVAATSGKVVDYDGRPAVTYFFASSGGETESVQNVWSGVAPEAWLVSKSDPYDDSYNNPHYRWKMSFNLGSAVAKLGKLVDGSLKGINIVRHGVSPRIVQAQVVGTKGRTTATGAQLQTALGTPSTWMSFTTVSAKGVRTTGSPPSPVTTSTATTTGAPTTTGTGGIGLGANARRRSAAGLPYAVTGSVYPVVAGATVSVQYDAGSGWTAAASGTASATGRYSIPVLIAGTYRVIYQGITGPKIAVG